MRKPCFFLFFFFYASICGKLFAAERPYQENSVAFSEEGGFTFKNDSELLRIGGYVNLDFRAFLGENSSKSTFLVRRARLYFAGKLYNLFGFLVMPRWDNHRRSELHYAFVETLFPKWGQWRIGLFKEPFSLEASKSVLYLNFMERSIAILNYSKVIDLGLMFYGEITQPNINYAIGCFNGRTNRLDNNNNKEIVGRIVFNPLLFGTKAKVFIGFSGSMGRFDEKLKGDEFITEGNTPFWRWKNVENHSTHYRIGMDVEWVSGPLYVAAEYIYVNWGRIRKCDRIEPFQGCGGYVECTYLLTGETKPLNTPVIPKENFDPCKNQWGAWEVGAKYEVFYASSNVLDACFANGANIVHSPIFGINWYLNPRLVVKLDEQYLYFNREVHLSSKRFHHELNVILRVQAIF